MKEYELESVKRTIRPDRTRERELMTWFDTEYVRRLLTIERYSYLGLTPPETRYSLECEAYKKENELRKLRGLEQLPAIKINDIL